MRGRPDRVLIAGHRGASVAAPENTLAAFAAGLLAGCDLIELDFHPSADGTLFAIHDETLDRTTDHRVRHGGAGIRVDRSTDRQLSRLDAGSWFGDEFRGERVPTLDASLDVIRVAAVPLLERKAGDAEMVVALLGEKNLLRAADWRAGAEGFAIVQAFDWAFLSQCRQRSRELVLGALGEGILERETIERAKAAGANFVGWREQDLDADAVARIEAAGMWASCWTVDDPGRAVLLARMGVRVLTTNDPSRIRQAVSREL